MFIQYVDLRLIFSTLLLVSTLEPSAHASSIAQCASMRDVGKCPEEHVRPFPCSPAVNVGDGQDDAQNQTLSVCRITTSTRLQCWMSPPHIG